MLRRLAITAACAIALALVGSNAQAATRSLVDGPGDVWTLAVPKPSRQPNHDQGDILRTTFTHAQRAVVVRTKFAELNREGQEILFFARLRTNTGLVRDLFVEASPQRATNRWRGKAALERRDGRTVDCALAQRIDYAANVAVMRVPRTCLNNPRTVQAKLAVVTFAGQHAFGDNPINHGQTENLPPYTAPVRRG